MADDWVGSQGQGRTEGATTHDPESQAVQEQITAGSVGATDADTG